MNVHHRLTSGSHRVARRLVAAILTLSAVPAVAQDACLSAPGQLLANCSFELPAIAPGQADVLPTSWTANLGTAIPHQVEHPVQGAGLPAAPGSDSQFLIAGDPSGVLSGNWICQQAGTYADGTYTLTALVGEPHGNEFPSLPSIALWSPTRLSPLSVATANPSQGEWIALSTSARPIPGDIGDPLYVCAKPNRQETLSAFDSFVLTFAAGDPLPPPPPPGSDCAVDGNLLPDDPDPSCSAEFPPRAPGAFGPVDLWTVGSNFGPQAPDTANEGSAVFTITDALPAGVSIFGQGGTSFEGQQWIAEVWFAARDAIGAGNGVLTVYLDFGGGGQETLCTVTVPAIVGSWTPAGCSATIGPGQINKQVYYEIKSADATAIMGDSALLKAVAPPPVLDGGACVCLAGSPSLLDCCCQDPAAAEGATAAPNEWTTSNAVLLHPFLPDATSNAAADAPGTEGQWCAVGTGSAGRLWQTTSLGNAVEGVSYSISAQASARTDPGQDTPASTAARLCLRLSSEVGADLCCTDAQVTPGQIVTLFCEATATAPQDGLSIVAVAETDVGQLLITDFTASSPALPPPNVGPSVTILTPADLAVLQGGGPFEFSGTAFDPEDGDLSEILIWSADLDGLPGLETLGTGRILLAGLPSGLGKTIQACATDTSFATMCDTVTVDVHGPPAVTITSPPDGGIVPAAALVGVTGSASDVDDGDVTASLNWSSDVDGDAWGAGDIGGDPGTAGLSAGPHVITATATDADGNISSASVSITVSGGLPDLSDCATAPGNLVANCSAEDDGLGDGLFELDPVSWTVINPGAGGAINHLSAAFAGATGGPLPAPAVGDSCFFTAPNTALIQDLGTAIAEDSDYVFAITCGQRLDNSVPPTAECVLTADGAGIGAAVLDCNPGAPVAASGDFEQIAMVWTGTAEFAGQDLGLSCAATGTPGQMQYDELIVVVGAPNPVSVTITQPLDGSICAEGAFVFMEGVATSTEGDISASISWSSSIDGFVGGGATISEILSLGAHTLTACAIDVALNTRCDSIAITVAATPPLPVVIIESPVNGQHFIEGTPVPLIGSAFDDDPPPAADLSASIVWSSNVDGQLCIGALCSAALTPGPHTITASVVGTLTGAPASGTVVVTVAPASPSQGACAPDRSQPSGCYDFVASTTCYIAFDRGVQYWVNVEYGALVWLTQTRRGEPADIELAVPFDDPPPSAAAAKLVPIPQGWLWVVGSGRFCLSSE